MSRTTTLETAEETERLKRRKEILAENQESHFKSQAVQLQKEKTALEKELNQKEKLLTVLDRIATALEVQNLMYMNCNNDQHDELKQIYLKAIAKK